ncbi:MAG TPA: hypothetical protein VMV05_02560 [bacterium]|nr:hypothetical protein [bacterium]
MSAKDDFPAWLHQPLLYFLVWTFALGLLSYGSLLLQTQLWLGLFGIGLPALLYLKSFSGVPLERSRVPGSIGLSPWLGGIAFLFAVLLRFYRLTDLSLWPNQDDGNYAFDGVELARKWDTVFFYSAGEVPPLFRWLEGFYFKAVPPSLFTLWFLPAILSVATVPVGYWAARQYFSKSFSLVCLVLLATGFWPAYLGRFCMEKVFLLFWEFLALGLLGKFLKTPGVDRAVALGAAVAGGFYVFAPPWSAVALAIALAVAGWSLRDRRARQRPLGAFLFGLALVFAPFIYEAILQGYGVHIRTLWEGGAGFSPFGRLNLGFHYLREIFFGNDLDGFVYGPFWGGLLNPLRGAACLLGAVEIVRNRRSPAAVWWLGAFLLFLIPGIASHDVEMMRVLTVIPLLVVATAMGFTVLADGFKPALAKSLLLGLLLVSAGLDFYHLAVPYAAFWRSPQAFVHSLKSEESYNAYKILSAKAAQEGPGLLFFDFVPVPLDQTLFIACEPFDAASNPVLKNRPAAWMAFVTNVNYRPFLEKRFPMAQWIQLGTQKMPWDGELMLGILPIDASARAAADLWLKCQPSFHEVTKQLVRLPEGKSREKILENFSREQVVMGGDPFLLSVSGEILYFNHSADGKFQESLVDLGGIMDKGYPAAHLFNELGGLLYYMKDINGAKKAFLKAVQLGGSHTLARENLGQLEGKPR